MTSQINPNLIDGAYPVAGQDNNSQGFRDNFTNTKNNFQAAANEITDLQSKVVLKSALSGTSLDNNMNDAPLVAAQIRDFSATSVAIVNTSGGVVVNYAAGHYQTISTSGSISLSFTNWPPTGGFGWVRLQITITNPAHTVTLPVSVSLGLSGIQGISPGIAGVPNTITFGAAGTYQFQFTSSDAGATVTLFDLNRALTNFTAGTFGVTDLVASGNVTANGTVLGGNVTASGAVSAGGNVTGANLRTTGSVVATGNVSGGNVVTTGQVSGNSIAGFINPTAGTGTTAPVQFTAGTLTIGGSAPAAGAMEYDGAAFYIAPAMGQRAVVAPEQFTIAGSNLTGVDTDIPQAVFPSPAVGTIALAPTTAYFIEAQYIIARSAGTNPQTMSLAFGTSGALASIAYTADVSDSASVSPTAVTRVYATTVNQTAITQSSGEADQIVVVTLRGIIKTAGGVNLTPQFAYSASPGGEPTVLANSYFRLMPVGTSTVTSVGNWS